MDLKQFPEIYLVHKKSWTCTFLLEALFSINTVVMVRMHQWLIYTSSYVSLATNTVSIAARYKKVQNHQEKCWCVPPHHSHLKGSFGLRFVDLFSIPLMIKSNLSLYGNMQLEDAVVYAV